MSNFFTAFTTTMKNITLLHLLETIWLHRGGTCTKKIILLKVLF